MKDFVIEVCSDLDYENMVVDISSDEGRIATLSCDDGIENPQIVFYDVKTDEAVFQLNYLELDGLLNLAFKKLKEVN